MSELMMLDAVRRENVNELTRLLNDGIDVDSKNAAGFTALYIACCRNQQEIVKVLLERNANANIKTNDYNSAMHELSRNGNNLLAELLIKYGVYINIRDMNGWTPLHEACENGHVEFVELLLKMEPTSMPRTTKDLLPYISFVVN